MTTVAIDLDGALGDTRPLWEAFLADLARRFAPIAELDASGLPRDRLQAARALDAWAERGVGDWRRALERFAEDHAALYVRPNAAANAAVRRLKRSGIAIVVFTDAPEALAQVVLAHVGVARAVDGICVGRPPRGARVVRETTELPKVAAPTS